MRKTCLVLIFCLCLVSQAAGEDLSPKDTILLEYPTNINYAKASWDTVVVKVLHGALVYWVPLSSNGAGEWSGSIYLPDSLPSGVPFGSWTRRYLSVYEGDTVAEDFPFSIRDTSELQGSASGLTVGAIIDSMAGMGWFSGLGVYQCTVYTKQEIGNGVPSFQPIPGVHILLRSADQTKNLAHIYTDANGMGILYYDTMATGYTHKFWMLDVDYSFNFPESLRIHNDTGVTFLGAPFDYGSPPAESLCAVYGQVFDPRLDSLTGVIVSAKVYVPGDSLLTYKGYPISPFTVADTTGVSGRWRIDLIPNDMFLPIAPDTTAYIFNFKYPPPWEAYSPPQDRDTVRVLRSHLPSVTYGELRGR